MVYDSTIAQVAASNPQAAYALANVPVAAPQAPQSQQPALQMARAPQADTVNFSSGAAVAYPPQEEKKSLLTLKNFVLGAGAFVLGRAGLKTNAVSNAFKELNVTAAGEAIAEGIKGTKVSDTHELSMLDTFLHYANPMNLFRKQAVPEGIADDAKGLIEKADGGLVFKHEDGIHFDLKAKEGVKPPVLDATPVSPTAPAAQAAQAIQDIDVEKQLAILEGKLQSPAFSDAAKVKITAEIENLKTAIAAQSSKAA